MLKLTKTEQTRLSVKLGQRLVRVGTALIGTTQDQNGLEAASLEVKAILTCLYDLEGAEIVPDKA